MTLLLLAGSQAQNTVGWMVTAGMALGMLKNGAETGIKALYSVIQCPTHGPLVLALGAAHPSAAHDLLR